MTSRIIFQQAEYRIVEMLDQYYNIEDLKGDTYNQAVHLDINPFELQQQEIEFEAKIISEGVYGYELQKWNPEIDTGWTHVDSCWGFVGQYDTKSNEYNHYIVNELKSQIKTAG